MKNMKKKFKHNILKLVLITAFINLSWTEKQSDWKLIKDENGIRAYTREVVGSDVKQVKVKTTLKSTLGGLVAIVKDVTSHKRWIYKCKTAKSVKVISDTEYYYYNEAEAPWPVSNRDIITHAVITQDPNTKTVTITSTGKPNFIKKIEGIERIQKLNAKWEFTPKANGFVDVSFYMLIDLGGSLPSWIINMAIADGPYETVYNLRKIVNEDKFQKAEYEFIEEL